MKLALLKDNNNLTQKQWEQCQLIRSKIIPTIENRKKIITSYNLDMKTSMPSAGWTSSSFSESEQGKASTMPGPNFAYPVLNGTYDVINRLRYFFHWFTGYYIVRLGPTAHTDHVGPILEVVSDQVMDNHHKQYGIAYKEWVVQWKKLISQTKSDKYVYKTPLSMGQIGGYAPHPFEDLVINYETVVYQERLTLMERGGLFTNNNANTIIEIGGGYGAIASAISRIRPNMSYVICDLPESLVYSGLYLSIVCPDISITIVYTPEDIPTALEQGGIILLPNYLFTKLADNEKNKFDIAINTLSLTEMSDLQIQMYVDGIKGLLNKNGKFFEQNQANQGAPFETIAPFYKDYLNKIFSYRQDIALDNYLIRQGVPTIWSLENN